MSGFFETYGASFLGLQVLRLYNEIDRGGSRALAAKSLDFPSRVASTLIYLKHCGPSSLVQLAKSISVSHQLISQRIDILDDAGLIKKRVDPEDNRRVLIELNGKGRKAAAKVEAACRLGEEAYRRLFEEIDADLFAIVVKACRALEDRSLDIRIREVAAQSGKAASTEAA